MITKSGIAELTQEASSFAIQVRANGSSSLSCYFPDHLKLCYTTQTLLLQQSEAESLKKRNGVFGEASSL
jgi:hypothetical protein